MDDRIEYIKIKGAEIVAKRQEIKRLESQISALKEEVIAVEKNELPTIMTELGLELIRLDDGTIIKKQPFYHARVIKDAEETAYVWLEQNGHGSVLKEALSLSLANLNDATKNAIKSLITENMEQFHIRPEIQKGVHFKTLESLGRELKEQGIELPKEAFTVFEGDEVVFK